MTTPAVLIGAARSGSGKTTLTLGLMRALTRRGLRVAAIKCGPDYIDPAFHAAAIVASSTIRLDPTTTSIPACLSCSTRSRASASVS